jgi:hypothetical protein
VHEVLGNFKSLYRGLHGQIGLRRLLPLKRYYRENYYEAYEPHIRRSGDDALDSFVALIETLTTATFQKSVDRDLSTLKLKRFKISIDELHRAINLGA